MRIENTKLTCPDCGGAIEKLEEEKLTQYRCRVGHLYSPVSALSVHAEREENTLWTAVVLLQEGADLADEIASLVTTREPQQLRDAAKAKHKLAEQVRTIVSEFERISLGLE